MKEKLQFKKEREMGSVLTDLFKFLRLEGKQLFGLIFKIAGPALLVLVLAYVFYMQTVFSGFGTIGVSSQPEVFTISFFLALLLIVIAGMVYYALMYGTIMYSIKSYINNDGVINKKEVTTEIKNDFWNLLGLSFLVTIILIISAILCFFPLFYTGVVLSTVYAIHVFEKKNITDSISYSFDLIKGEFWMTLLTYVVLFLLYYFLTSIMQIPQYIYIFSKDFIFSETVSSDPSEMFDWVYITINAIAIIGQYLLYTIIVLSTAFIYFNLNEKKNFTGTMETIESIGTDE